MGELRGEVGGLRRDGVVGRVRLGDAGLRGRMVNVVEGDAAAGAGADDARQVDALGLRFLPGERRRGDAAA